MTKCDFSSALIKKVLINAALKKKFNGMLLSRDNKIYKNIDDIYDRHYKKKEFKWIITSSFFERDKV